MPLCSLLNGTCYNRNGLKLLEEKISGNIREKNEKKKKLIIHAAHKKHGDETGISHLCLPRMRGFMIFEFQYNIIFIQFPGSRL